MLASLFVAALLVACVVFIVDGMGHQWPGGAPFPPWLMGEPNDDVEATEALWAFFQAHSLEAAP